jgi:hypothetical protein
VTVLEKIEECPEKRNSRHIRNLLRRLLASLTEEGQLAREALPLLFRLKALAAAPKKREPKALVLSSKTIQELTTVTDLPVASAAASFSDGTVFMLCGWCSHLSFCRAIANSWVCLHCLNLEKEAELERLEELEKVHFATINWP